MELWSQVDVRNGGAWEAQSGVVGFFFYQWWQVCTTYEEQDPDPDHSVSDPHHCFRHLPFNLKYRVVSSEVL
jgi:hypothetical protein